MSCQRFRLPVDHETVERLERPTVSTVSLCSSHRGAPEGEQQRRSQSGQDWPPALPPAPTRASSVPVGVPPDMDAPWQETCSESATEWYEGFSIFFNRFHVLETCKALRACQTCQTVTGVSVTVTGVSVTVTGVSSMRISMPASSEVIEPHAKVPKHAEQVE